VSDGEEAGPPPCGVDAGAGDSLACISRTAFWNVASAFVGESLDTFVSALDSVCDLSKSVIVSERGEPRRPQSTATSSAIK
jgi:hypothetical protein